MKSLADLEEWIRELLINNYWDIDIYDHPDLMQEAKKLGLDESQLNQKVIEIDSSTDKRPYALIDKAMEEAIATGKVQDKDLRKAIETLEGKLPDPVVARYLIHKIKRHRFEPRNRVPLDWSSFRNPWMTDEAWKKFQETHLEVEWLGEKARTLEQMGEISFRKKEDAQYYTRNTNYLPTLITILTKNPNQADNFSKIIDEEQDPEVRYLNIIYRLDPSLPFRFRGAMYSSVADLVNAGCTSAEAFWMLAEMYNKRYIHIWLTETNAPAKSNLTAERHTNGFLQFIYRLNPQYPFFVKHMKFDTPAALAAEARKNSGIWPDIITAIENDNIRTWFQGIGQHALNTNYESAMAPLSVSKLYSVDDKRLAYVQALISVLDDATVGAPFVESTPKIIKNLFIEGGKPVTLPLKVKLINEGFLRVGVAFDQVLEGVAIDRYAIGFFSQTGKTEEVLYFSIDPTRLIKDKIYRSNILLASIYGTTTIPVELKVVFPKKAFLTHLAKYAVFGALLFGLVSFVIQYISLTRPLSTDNRYLLLESADWNFPLGYLVYIVPVALLVFALFYSIFLIRKYEKI